jgi:3D (Asp-Asp-Asp) domain-containing protein
MCDKKGGEMRKYASIALVISTLLISNNAGGQENNYPNQTFRKCVQYSLANGGFKEMTKKPEQAENYTREFIGEITAYTIDEGDKSPSDKEYGITASMTKARTHHTIAASRSIPFGSKVRIEGLPYTFVVEDRGGAITGNKIDMLVGSSKEANQWGRQKRKVTIISEGDK